jgi:hypothetical protein
MRFLTRSRFWDDAETRLRLLGSVLAGALSLFIAHAVFLNGYLTADEASYVFQAYCFLDGLISRPLPPIYPVFDHFVIILKPGFGWLSRYSPGHVLWLLPGICLDAPRIMSALAAGLSVWFLTGCGRLLSIRPGIILFLVFCSPYFIFMSGTLLSHTSAHLFFVLFVWAYLSWLNTRELRLALLCGLSWAFLFLIRNYTAVLICLPFAIHALVHGLTHRNRTVWTGLVTMGLGALSGVILLLLYNYLAVGDALLNTYLVYNPGETLGFGWRYMHDNNDYGFFTWQIGVKLMLQSLGLLDRWVWGFHGALAGVAVLWIAGWSRPWSLVFAGAAGALWIGYVFFPSRSIDVIGPFYYFESLPCLILAAALGIRRIISLGQSWPPRLWRVSAAVCMLAMICLAALFTWKHSLDFRSKLAYDLKIRQVLRRAPPDSLVFLSGLKLFFQDHRANPRGLRSQPLVARAMGDEVNLAVAKCFPERTPYILRNGCEDTLIPFDHNRRLETFRTAAQCHGYTGQMEPQGAGAPDLRVGREGRDAAHWIVCRNYLWVCPGRFTASYEIAYSNVAPDKPITLDILAVQTNQVLVEKRLSGSQSNAIYDLEFAANAAAFLEFRIHYGGSGAAVPQSIRVREK